MIEIKIEIDFMLFMNLKQDIKILEIMIVFIILYMKIKMKLVKVSH